MEAEHYETIVIGGSQAGLTAGYYLAREGREFLILEANDSVGDAWRNRWDSLRLFTPAKFSRLPGMRIPDASAWYFVTKDEMADYLEEYARRFKLPVHTGVTVDGLTRADGRFVGLGGPSPLRSRERDRGDRRASDRARFPAFASELDPRIVQMHSSEYRGPSQLAEGDVLVVGAGQLRRRDRVRARRDASLPSRREELGSDPRAPRKPSFPPRLPRDPVLRAPHRCGSTRGSGGSSGRR